MNSQHRDDDLEDLRKDVESIFEIVSEFRWGDLSDRLPVERSYVRPPSEGPYAAVAWRCDWSANRGGPIRCAVAGYLTEGNQTPLFQMECEISRTSLWDDVLHDLRRPFGKRRRSKLK